ncbi:MAG TPA: copper resistance protein CopC [Gaiellaceae bacterium]|nr:copper resistance protein CopC [Gaiellaceae bacterium]
MKRALLAASAVALALPAAAVAHANLVRIEPASGSVLTRAPREVRVVFDDAVRVGPGNAAVRNGGGSVLAGRALVSGRRTLVLPLRAGLPDGDYSVRWAIVSDDGHLESGVIAFAVGAGRAPPQAALAAEATGPDAGSVLERWLFLAGVLVAAGLAVHALVVLRRVDEVAAERLPLLLSAATALAAVGSGSEIHRVGLGTRDGAALAAGFVLAVLVGLLAGAATLERRALRPALVLALGLAAVPSVAGHALDPGLPRANVVVDVLHVLAAATWVGVLLGLLALPAGAAELRRGALVALGAVALLAVTGAIRASYELLAVRQLWQTGYGRSLLVKTGILLAALAAGWLLRGRLRRRLAVELLLVAGLLVAVAVLVQLRPGRNAVPLASAAAVPAALEPSPQPPAPPPDALVLAREAGPLAVALEAEPRRLTAVVLSPAGGGLSGLRVRFLPADAAATRCGSGCYRAAVAPGRRVTVEIAGFGPTRRVAFSLPAHAPAADGLVRRARAVYRALAGVAYTERLASDPTHSVTARWRLERPDRLAYEIPGGAAAVVVGDRRWDSDRPGGRWRASPQVPRLPQPATQWTRSTNARVLARTATSVTVAFADPSVPAFFTLTLDPRTLRPRVLRMTAAAHFMTDRYTGFSRARAIRPPHALRRAGGG